MHVNVSLFRNDTVYVLKRKSRITFVGVFRFCAGFFVCFFFFFFSKVSDYSFGFLFDVWDGLCLGS